MSRNNQSSCLARDSERENQPLERVLDLGHEGDGIEQVPSRICLFPSLGADDFAEQKERAIPAPKMPDGLAAMNAELQSKFGFHDILSKSPLMHSVFNLIYDLAHAKATVLIEGKTGTGKELVARAIHVSATQRPGRFVTVNCAALPETLLESELFGHEKGAFTGAVGQRRGRFEMAEGGSIFLDEVGDMPSSMQVKLLRVLQERSFERVGGTETININVRVICATNRSLQTLMRKGKFREDLFYRLNVVKINLPPLCHRPEDIPMLAAHFIDKHARFSEAPKLLSTRALEVLVHYSWPGNIRELENAIERACITSHGPTIEVEDLPPEVIAPIVPLWPFLIDLKKPLTEQVREAVGQIESQYISKALAKTHGHVGKSARLCGLSRRCLTTKIARYRLDRLKFQED